MILLDLQNFVLKLSPALMPLLTIPLSFVQSWHCSMMCGPFFITWNKPQRNRYLQGRWLSYTSAGAVFGALGESLRRLLEVEILGAIAFFIFFGLALILALIWLGASPKWFKVPSISSDLLRRVSHRSSFVHGVLSVALPCGLLYQVFGLSALCHSWVGGLLVGSAHATVTMPSFWLSSKLMTRFKEMGSKGQLVVRVLMLLLILFNLLFFAGQLLDSEDVAKTKVLFCL